MKKTYIQPTMKCRVLIENTDLLQSSAINVGISSSQASSSSMVGAKMTRYNIWDSEDFQDTDE